MFLTQVGRGSAPSPSPPPAPERQGGWGRSCPSSPLFLPPQFPDVEGVPSSPGVGPAGVGGLVSAPARQVLPPERGVGSVGASPAHGITPTGPLPTPPAEPESGSAAPGSLRGGLSAPVPALPRDGRMA